MKVWLDRLPPDYRRRFYTNTAILVGLLVCFIVIGRLGARDGTIAVEVLMAAAVLFSWIYPVFRLIRARPGRTPFIMYAAWTSAYIYVGVAIFVPWLFPSVPIVLIFGGVLMCAFYVIYRKIIFPDFFGGVVRARWRAIREAQKAAREANKIAEG